MGSSWKHDRAGDRIDKRLAEVATVDIRDYVRRTELASIPTARAYRLRAAHLYVDILNLGDILGTTGTEGETCHRRALRFLDLHQRAVHRILKEADAIKVDFHNQRLHALVTTPYGSDETNAGGRVHRAVAIAQLIIDVLTETGDDDDGIPSAKVRVGIDEGLALAVNNGRAGGREPLFLGDPANHAAKRSGGGRRSGIFLTTGARAKAGLTEVDDEDKTALTAVEVGYCDDKAGLGVSKDRVVRLWREDLSEYPLRGFAFSRHTPPLRSLDFGGLRPKNSKRQDALSLYADLDGFTAYVAARLGKEEGEKEVVRSLHVIRSELDAVLTSDFGGLKVRFIGDCLHGLLCEGTAYTTYNADTVSTATLCAGGLRSGFDLALEKLGEAGVAAEGLGLAIGLEFGPMTMTRLGMRGSRTRCSVSRGTLAAESEQQRCGGRQTRLGEAAYAAGNDAVRRLFGPSRVRSDLDYDAAVDALADQGDRVAKAALSETQAVYATAAAAAVEHSYRPHSRD